MALYSPDGSKILIVTDKCVSIADVQERFLKCLCKLDNGLVQRAAWTLDGLHLAVVTDYGLVQIYDAVAGTVTRQIERSDLKKIYSLDVSPDARYLIVTYADQRIGYQGPAHPWEELRVGVIDLQSGLYGFRQSFVNVTADQYFDLIAQAYNSGRQMVACTTFSGPFSLAQLILVMASRLAENKQQILKLPSGHPLHEAYTLMPELLRSTLRGQLMIAQ